MSKRSEIEPGLGNFIKAAWLELPAAVAQRALGAGSAENLRNAGWKAYDAWVALANETTNRLYENEAFAAVTGRAMESSLRLQQIGGAAASAFFGNLWPAIGLPTANQIASLRGEVDELRTQLEQPTDGEKAQFKANQDGLHLVRGHGQMKREDEEHAAA